MKWGRGWVILDRGWVIRSWSRSMNNRSMHNRSRMIWCRGRMIGSRGWVVRGRSIGSVVWKSSRCMNLCYRLFIPSITMDRLKEKCKANYSSKQ